MSEETPLNLEDRAILQALRTLEATTREELLGELRSGEEESLELVRIYTELLGLVPWSVDWAEPSPELEGRILASLVGDETQRITLEELRPQAPPAATVRSVPEQRPVRTLDVRPTPAPTGMTWWKTLAAALTLGVLGLGATLYSTRLRLDDQIARADQLEKDLSRAEAQPTDVRAASDNELDAMRAQVQLVTNLNTGICPLRPPVGKPALQPAARGLLFVAEDHQHWYLKAEGLDPLETGRTYQLWFVIEEGDSPVSAGTFEVIPGRQVEMTSPEMPHGTRAVAITLEPAGGATQPSGPMVLYGDEIMQFI
ncbi:MAG: anti-sigma factor [Thermoanaerobaculia bacterium]|nr:anti-sigma factor [Thermoanaerobaculia bacterium]